MAALHRKVTSCTSEVRDDANTKFRSKTSVLRTSLCGFILSSVGEAALRRDSEFINMLCTDVSEMFAAAVCGKQNPKSLRIKNLFVIVSQNKIYRYSCLIKLSLDMKEMTVQETNANPNINVNGL